jgi:glycosyltransferase involved in cell wall biosynthesis
VVDVFVPDTADERFLPLKEVANKVEVFPVRKTFTGFISSVIYYRNLGLEGSSLVDLKRTQKNIANIINKSDYEVVFIEQDKYTMSPFFLKYIKKPAVYYCQQPVRANEAILKRVSEKVHETSNLFVKTQRRIWHEYLKSKIKIDRQNASFAKYILANSYFSRESILRAYGLNSFVCYLGVDTEIFRPLNSSKENFVLSVGSCHSAKGYDFIISSLSHIDEKIRPKFIIISNSVSMPYKNYLERLASQNEVEIEIKSLVEDKELVQYYNRARLFLYAPYLEPFGLAPVEAMACGIPVIAVREGGVRESVIHNETGLLVERDEVMFAEAITDLLLDERRCQKMSKRGIETVREFWTFDHAGERLLWHLARAIKLWS